MEKMEPDLRDAVAQVKKVFALGAFIVSDPPVADWKKPKEVPAERWVYWKPEAKATRWISIPDTPEARSQAIKDGAMFFTWACVSKPYEGNGDGEPHRWGNLPLDFDSPDDVGRALMDLRRLCFDYLPKYGIDPSELHYYLSGGKGFHVVIPARLLNAEGGDPQLPLIYKEIVAQWKKDLGLDSLDMCLYCMKRGRMFRIPNVRRANGRYKVELTLDETRRRTVDELTELGTAPRNPKRT